jgi:hypothetical protein
MKSFGERPWDMRVAKTNVLNDEPGFRRFCVTRLYW